MATLLLMPEIATGDEAATLTSWAVAVGAPFRATDTIATIETAKAAVEVEAEADGVILGLLVEAGTDVAVGDVLALIGSPGESVADIGAVLAELGVSDGVVGVAPPVTGHAEDDGGAVPPVEVTPRSEPVPDENPVAAAVPPRGEPPRPPAGAPPPALPAQGVAGMVDGTVGASGHPVGSPRIFASPLARRLAREAGLALGDLVGTGPRGRIGRDDVRAAQTRLSGSEPAPAPAAESGVAEPAAVDGAAASDPGAAVAGRTPAAATPVTATPAPAGHVDIPHTRLRRAIARRLAESVTTAPQFTVSAVVGVDRLLALRAEINASTPLRVSVNDLLVKAVACAHLAVPAMNVVWTPDAVRRFHAVDIGIAVTTPTGLVVPVLRGVDRLRLGEIAAASADLVSRARDGQLRPAELEGGTVSVSNLGMYGTRSFTAILNPPHAAILAVGAAAPEAAVVDGAVVARTALHLTVSVDHRPVDGAIAAEWMRALVDVLEHPLGLVL